MRDLWPVHREPADGGVRSAATLPGLRRYRAPVADLPGARGWCERGRGDVGGAVASRRLRLLLWATQLERGRGLTVNHGGSGARSAVTRSATPARFAMRCRDRSPPVLRR